LVAEALTSGSEVGVVLGVGRANRHARPRIRIRAKSSDRNERLDMRIVTPLFRLRVLKAG
jgi:hypothetical protein